MTITNTLNNGNTNEIYTLELFTVGKPTDELLQWLKEMPQVKEVYFESNPNKIHDSILVDIEIITDTVEEFEEITDYIENEYYARHEVIDCYEYYSNCMEW